MPNFTAGTSFTDGVTNDVTAAKLNALVADAVPTSSLALNSTNGTIANFTASTANITLGTIPTLTAGTTTGTAGVFTSGTITTGVIPTLTAGTTTSTNAVVTNGTITNLSATTSTFLGTITGSTNVVNIGSGQIYKDASGNVGIGNASPNGTLDVSGSLIVRGYNTSNTSVTAQNGFALGTVAKNTSPSAGQGAISILSNDASNRLEASVSLISDATASNRRLAIGVVEQGVAHRNVTIAESGGNVGIGTTSPDSVLSVYAPDKTTPAISARYNAAGFKAGLSVYNSLGFPYLSFNSNPVAGATNNATYDINGVASKIDFATGSGSADIIFSNAASGTAGSTISWSERMRIASAGQIGIGGANYGTSGQALVSNGASAAPSWQSVSAITMATAVASTSGTAIDFTGIPSGVKRITVMFNGVSTNGTSPYEIRIGSGSIDNSGYLGSAQNFDTTAISNSGNFSSGFRLCGATSAVIVAYGNSVITHMGSNIFTFVSQLARTDLAAQFSSSGLKTISGTLDRLRITTTHGINTFDAGSINILYES